MASPSIAIIGAGVSGSGAAMRAAQLGADVLVLDQDHPGSGSSGRSAGVYNIQTLDPLDVEIRVRARELFFRLEQDRGLHLSRIGNVRVATDDTQIARLEQVIELQRSLGADDSEVLDRAALQRLVPDLRTDDLAGGLFGPNDGHLDGHQLCDALLAEAVDAGAVVRPRSTVSGHRVASDGRHVLTVNGTEIEPVDVVINAAGPWAAKVGDLLGHPVPLVPQVHEVIQVRLPRDLGYVVPMVNLYMPGQEGDALYFRQDGPDSLIAGMHTYAVLDHVDIADPDDYRSKVDEDYLIEVAEALSARFLVDDLGFKPGWTGIYPLSPDSKFILGPESDPTVVTCAGLGGVGVTMGAVAGASAAEWAIQGEPTTVAGISALRPDRPDIAGRASSEGHA